MIDDQLARVVEKSIGFGDKPPKLGKRSRGFPLIRRVAGFRENETKCLHL